MKSLSPSDGGFIPLATPEDYEYKETAVGMSNILKSIYVGPVLDQMQAQSLLRFTGSEHKY